MNKGRPGKIGMPGLLPSRRLRAGKQNKKNSGGAKGYYGSPHNRSLDVHLQDVPVTRCERIDIFLFASSYNPIKQYIIFCGQYPISTRNSSGARLPDSVIETGIRAKPPPQTESRRLNNPPKNSRKGLMSLPPAPVGIRIRKTTRLLSFSF